MFRPLLAQSPFRLRREGASHRPFAHSPIVIPPISLLPFWPGGKGKKRKEREEKRKRLVASKQTINQSIHPPFFPLSLSLSLLSSLTHRPSHHFPSSHPSTPVPSLAAVLARLAAPASITNVHYYSSCIDDPFRNRYPAPPTSNLRCLSILQVHCGCHTYRPRPRPRPVIPISYNKSTLLLTHPT